MNHLAKTFTSFRFKSSNLSLVTLPKNQARNFNSLRLKFFSMYVADSLLPVVFVNENMEVELAPKIRRDLSQVEWKALPSDLKQLILKQFYEQL